MTAIPDSRPQDPPGRRRRGLVLALLLGAVVVGAAAAAFFVLFREKPPEPPDAPTDDSNPQVAVAVRLARERVLKEPRSGAAWGELGEVFIANEQEAESDFCFAQAERLDPNNPRWPYFRGGAVHNQGDRAGALPYFRRAVDRVESGGETNDTPRLLLAETLLALGRLDEAEGHYRRVLERRPDDLRGHYGMGLLAIARDDWAGARDHLRPCLGSPQAQKKACVQLAVVSQRLGDDAEADKFRQQADRLPNDLDWTDPYVTEYLKWAVKKRSRYRRADDLTAAGRFAEAIKVLQPMTEDYPDDYLPQLTLARNLGQQGDTARAERALRRANQLAPEKAQVHYYLSLILMLKGEELTKKGEADQARAAFSEAAVWARKVLAVTPDNGLAYLTLGKSLKALGERADALTALRQAVSCSPELAELHYYLGDLLAEDAPGAEARRQLEEALEFGPPQAAWRPQAQARLKALAK
jgi:tetratricopeptide (TPR) repeat protein